MIRAAGATAIRPWHMRFPLMTSITLSPGIGTHKPGHRLGAIDNQRPLIIRLANLLHQGGSRIYLFGCYPIRLIF